MACEGVVSGDVRLMISSVSSTQHTAVPDARAVITAGALVSRDGRTASGGPSHGM